MRRLHPAVGGIIFLVGIVLFVVGIVDATSGAPSGSLSRKGTDTPWVLFAGIGCAVVGGVLFSVAASSRARARAVTSSATPLFVSPPPAAEDSPSPDPIQQLERLAALREAGALSAAEFEEQKARILRDV